MFSNLLFDTGEQNILANIDTDSLGDRGVFRFSFSPFYATAEFPFIKHGDTTNSTRHFWSYKHKKNFTKLEKHIKQNRATEWHTEITRASSKQRGRMRKISKLPLEYDK